MRTSLPLIIAAAAAVVLVSCKAQDPGITTVTDRASVMLTDQIAAIDATGKILFPNTITEDAVPFWDYDAPGTNGNFILMHSVGSIPHGNEIDVPLSYANYDYLEALTRKK